MTRPKTLMTHRDAVMYNHAANRDLITLDPTATRDRHTTARLISWPTPWSRDNRAHLQLPSGAHITTNPNNVTHPDLEDTP